MLIAKNIFSATKNIHQKKPTSWKITLQVNKSKTKFDALLFKFFETLETNAQASSEISLLLKLQLFVFTFEEVCIKRLARLPAVTNVLEYSFGKPTKQIKWMA